MPDPISDFTDIKEVPLRAGLYLVATPIGNMRDITLRALDVLKAVDVVACEDTRVSGKLFAALGMKKKLMPYHDHNADAQRPVIMDKIRAGETVALISDAGMPLISDPGYKLVRECQVAGLHVTSCPGANAPLMAMQLSGLPTDNFSFLGFLPQKSKARQDALMQWKNVSTTLVIFESAARLEASCADILAALGDRPMALTRELTKMFEDVWHGRVSDILARLKKDGTPKGEIVLVVGAGEAEEKSAQDIDALLIHAMAHMSVKEAVASVVGATGLPKKQIYDRAIKLKE